MAEGPIQTVNYGSFLQCKGWGSNPPYSYSFGNGCSPFPAATFTAFFYALRTAAPTISPVENYADPGLSSSEKIGFKFDTYESMGVNQYRAGTWTFRFNIPACGDGTRISSIYVCDVTGTAPVVSRGTICSGDPGMIRGSTGILTFMIEQEEHYFPEDGGRFMIICHVDNNASSGESKIYLLPNQLIVSPLRPRRTGAWSRLCFDPRRW